MLFFNYTKRMFKIKESTNRLSGNIWATSTSTS